TARLTQAILTMYFPSPRRMPVTPAHARHPGACPSPRRMPVIPAHARHPGACRDPGVLMIWITRYARPTGRPCGRSTRYALLSGMRRNEGLGLLEWTCQGIAP